MAKSGDANTTQRVRTARTTRPTSTGACMVVIKGERLGQCIDLHEVPVVIGRAPSCDFQIEHRSVSRAHCKVFHDSGGFFVADLGSTNRTFVNRVPVSHAELADGDHIAVGETVLKFVLRGSDEARYHEALYQLASVDSLTQLYNRRKFRELLEEAVQRAHGVVEPLALVFMDLDHFKTINDELGHLAGDDVLRAVSGVMRDGLIDGEIGGRLGGEEFAVFYPGATLAHAVAKAEALRGAVAATETLIEGRPWRVTASFGVAALDGTMRTAADLMRDADAELFRAKAAGRDRVCHDGD